MESGSWSSRGKREAKCRALAAGTGRECETAFRKGGQSTTQEWQAVAFLLGFLGTLALLAAQRRHEIDEEMGRDTSVSVPLSLCPSCRGWPVSTALLSALRAIRWSLILAIVVTPFFWRLWGLLLVLPALAVVLLEIYLARRRQRGPREMLRKVPAYARLLEAYQDVEINF